MCFKAVYGRFFVLSLLYFFIPSFLLLIFCFCSLVSLVYVRCWCSYWVIASCARILTSVCLVCRSPSVWWWAVALPERRRVCEQREVSVCPGILGPAVREIPVRRWSRLQLVWFGSDLHPILHRYHHPAASAATLLLGFYPLRNTHTHIQNTGYTTHKT